MTSTTPTVEPAPPELPVEPAPGPVVRPQPPEGMFTSLADQLATIRRWNDELGWGFTGEDFDAVDLTPAHHDDPLVVDLIAIYLPGDDELDGVRRTAEELWAIIAEQQPNAWCWDMPKRSNKPVRLLRRIEHRPGLRRVTLDLGAHWDSVAGVRPIEVRGPDAAHAEVLAAAALFPDWVRAIDGLSVPHVILSGYQIAIPLREAWRHVPCLAWNERFHRINLTDHWADQPQPRFASPVIVSP